MVKTLADRLAVVKAKTFSDALGHVEAASHVNKLAATLEKIEAKMPLAEVVAKTAYETLKK